MHLSETILTSAEAAVAILALTGDSEKGVSEGGESTDGLGSMYALQEVPRRLWPRGAAEEGPVGSHMAS